MATRTERYYYCIESDSIISYSEVMETYYLFADEYQSTSDYLQACMYYNNGSLLPINVYIRRLKADIIRLENTWGNMAEEDIKAIKSQIYAIQTLLKEGV